MIISLIKKGCKVGFFGLGKSNIALLSALPLEKCEITLRSDKKINEIELQMDISFQRILCGDDSLKDIDEEIIFFSPSVRRERAELMEARRRGVIFTSDAEMFFEGNRTPIFAVTGSDGKSTTATLIHLLLSEEGKRSELIGNIGRPMINSLGQGSDYLVCELSSFMLRYLRPKSYSACITNITPNHLDWHENLDEYRECKRNVLVNTGRIVLNDENSNLTEADAIVSVKKDYEALRKEIPAKVYVTIENDFLCRNGLPLLPKSEIKRCEIHNIQNLMMAIAMTDGIVGQEAIKRVAKEFSGLGHRCEMVGRISDVECYDSSIDSSVARTLQTLRSLDREVVIILGGKSKGLDYKSLLPDAKKWVRRAIICGENAEEIFHAIGDEIESEIIDDFDMAIKRGIECAKNVGILLLSPASTSYDKFKNYAERGNRFKEILAEIRDIENNSLQNIEETRKNGETNLS